MNYLLALKFDSVATVRDFLDSMGNQGLSLSGFGLLIAVAESIAAVDVG